MRNSFAYKNSILLIGQEYPFIIGFLLLMLLSFFSFQFLFMVNIRSIREFKTNSILQIFIAQFLIMKSGKFYSWLIVAISFSLIAIR